MGRTRDEVSRDEAGSAVRMMLRTGDGIGQTRQVIKKESGKGGGCGIAALAALTVNRGY